MHKVSHRQVAVLIKPNSIRKTPAIMYGIYQLGEDSERNRRAPPTEPLVDDTKTMTLSILMMVKSLIKRHHLDLLIQYWQRLHPLKVQSVHCPRRKGRPSQRHLASQPVSAENNAGASGSVAIPMEDTNTKDTKKKKACTGRTGWFATIGVLVAVLVVLVVVIVTLVKLEQRHAVAKHVLYGSDSKFYIYQYVINNHSDYHPDCRPYDRPYDWKYSFSYSFADASPDAKLL